MQNQERQFLINRAIVDIGSSNFVIGTIRHASLEDYLKAKTTPVNDDKPTAINDDQPTAVDIRRMVLAVSELHSRKIIHRNITRDAFEPETYKLRNFEHAIYTIKQCLSHPVNWRTGAVTDPDIAPATVQHTVNDTLYDSVKYGPEYDIWCLGEVIFTMLYGIPLADAIPLGSKFSESAVEKYTWSQPFAVEIKNPEVFRLVIRATLRRSDRRISAYALRNICDCPRSESLYPRRFNSPPYPALDIAIAALILKEHMGHDEYYRNTCVSAMEPYRKQYEIMRQIVRIIWSEQAEQAHYVYQLLTTDQYMSTLSTVKKSIVLKTDVPFEIIF